MSLNPDQAVITARAFVDESLESSTFDAGGFGFQFDADSGFPIVVENVPAVIAGQLFEYEKTTGLIDWLGAIAYTSGREASPEDIRLLAHAIIVEIVQNFQQERDPQFHG